MNEGDCAVVAGELVLLETADEGVMKAFDAWCGSYGWFVYTDGDLLRG